MGDGGFGGGLYMSTAAAGVPQSNFTDCIFEYSHCGGGAGGTHIAYASPSFARCVWRNNTVGDGGYGVGMELYNEADGAPPSSFADCVFEYNAGGSEGGGTNVQFASPTFARCVWRGNTAGGGGGLNLFSHSANTGAPPSSLLNCTFERNNVTKGDGGAVFAMATPGVRFVGVVFLRNEAPAGSVGAVLFEASVSSSQILVGFEHCRFDSNRAAKGGGAVSLTIYPTTTVAVAGSTSATGAAAPPAVCTLLGTLFVDNRATTGAGGAVEAVFPPDTPANLHFLNDSCAGAVCGSPDDPSYNTPPDHVSNTTRTWSRSVVLRLTDIVFHANSAGNGGALAVTNGAVAMSNATMKVNSAAVYGGAVFLGGTASLSASETSWVGNIVDRLQQAASADGQHVYAASGAGKWGFSGITAFEHANANESGLSAAKIDGAHGLVMLTIKCPAGAVATKLKKWASNFTAQSGDWRLGPGVTTTTITGAFYNVSSEATCNGGPIPPLHESFCQLPSSIIARNNTRCEAEYFANFMCRNPPPVYPAMNYTTVSIGCKQCDRSEAALPAGEHRGGSTNSSSRCEPCPDAWTNDKSAACDSGHVVQALGWWRPEGDSSVTTDTQFWACYSHEKACIGSKGNRTAGAPAFDAQCARGHTGPVCGLCKPDYAMRLGRCADCTGGNAAASAAITAAFFATLVGCCCLLFRWRLRLGIEKKFATSAKIVVGFYSLLALVTDTFAIVFPPGFDAILAALQAAFSSIGDLSTLACIGVIYGVYNKGERGLCSVPK
jgi:predicted outer membrane repeat protein